MTQKPEISDVPRLNVSLTGDSAVLLEKIRASIEKRLGIKVSSAFAVKLALREMASLENVD
jgi:hypothetical protein